MDILNNNQHQLIGLSHGMNILRDDLRNSQEEAGVIIIRQMLFIVEWSINDIKISVILNHTDVFI